MTDDCGMASCPKAAECVRANDDQCPYIQYLRLKHGPRFEWGLTEDELMDTYKENEK